jgi:hypothetical protein
LPDTLDECKELYKNKFVVLQDLKKKSLATRHEEMEARANIAATLGNNTQKLHADKLRSGEAHAEMYRKV